VSGTLGRGVPRCGVLRRAARWVYDGCVEPVGVRAGIVAASLALSGCFLTSEPDAPPGDAGTDARMLVPGDAGPKCHSDVECLDDVFCNGREFCDPRDSRANWFGCVAGSPECRDSLVCTIEHEPVCDEAAQRCAPITLDHSRCPAGFYCQRTWGCTPTVECPADGSACPEDDNPCTAARCDAEADPARCVSDEVLDDTPCTNPTGAAGICYAGRCCLDCTPAPPPP